MEVTTEPTQQYFLAHARWYMDRRYDHLDFASPLTAEETTLIIATFGTLPFVCVKIWEMLRIYTDCTEANGAQPFHILWALLELKQYQTAIVTARAIVGVTEKTFSKWAWLFADGIACLEAHVVSAFWPRFMSSPLPVLISYMHATFVPISCPFLLPRFSGRIVSSVISAHQPRRRLTVFTSRPKNQDRTGRFGMAITPTSSKVLV